jgi:Cu/Ag efflux protein CusF
LRPSFDHGSKAQHFSFILGRRQRRPRLHASMKESDEDITEIDGNRVTISHGPAETVDWPAMSMTFVEQSPDMIDEFSVEDR